jgi:hypothetical protein
MLCLTSDILDRLFVNWGLDWIRQEQPDSHILLAIRGSKRASSPDNCGTHFSRKNLFTKKVFLESAKLDYQHMKCMLGMWKPQEQTLWLGIGSTVPHKKWVDKAIKQEGKGCNQLEPGFYTDLTKGEHLQGKPRGHMALRQTAYRCIRRTARGIPYNKQDPLFYSNPYDNFHCAGNPHPEKAGYDSAGCLVLAGTAYRSRLPKEEQVENTGPWAFFHDAVYDASLQQEQFPMLVMEYSTLEKWYQSPDDIESLCFGSRGERVLTLQKKLKQEGLYKGKLDGLLGARTYRGMMEK